MSIYYSIFLKDRMFLLQLCQKYEPAQVQGSDKWFEMINEDIFISICESRIRDSLLDDRVVFSVGATGPATLSFLWLCGLF